MYIDDDQMDFAEEDEMPETFFSIEKLTQIGKEFEKNQERIPENEIAGDDPNKDNLKYRVDLIKLRKQLTN